MTQIPVSLKIGKSPYLSHIWRDCVPEKNHIIILVPDPNGFGQHYASLWNVGSIVSFASYVRQAVFSITDHQLLSLPNPNTPATSKLLLL